jgi:hypothetical protein
MKQSISKTIADKTVQNQGCSMNIYGKEPVKGFMVSLKGYEAQENLLDFDQTNIEKFIKANSRPLYGNPNLYIGTWVNGDQVCIDLSINLQSRGISIAYGKLNGQTCIYDVLNKKEVYWLEPTL